VTVTAFEKTKGGMLGLVVGESRPDHVQVRKADNLDGLTPDAAISLSDDGTILIQIRNNSRVVLTCREN
jgi:hypothetical protein